MTTARVIAIDGPAGSGKGTAAAGVAQALGYAWIDTGALYRSVALLALRQGVAWSDGPALGRIAKSLPIRFSWEGSSLVVWLADEDASAAIRAARMGVGASEVSRHPEVRSALLGLQRALAREGGVVMDGRDIGTVVLPDADLKISLDASLDERSRRRAQDLATRGTPASMDEVRAAIARRDAQDQGRDLAPLRPAQDAVIVDTTALSEAEVQRRLLDLAQGK